MPLEIIHLKQLHEIPGIPEYDSKNSACVQFARAQHEIGSYLIHNANIPVLEESLYNDINCVNSNSWCNLTKQIAFPNG